MGRRSLLLTALLAGTAGPEAAGERRVAPVATSCPADAPARRIDAQGAADACAQEATPSCAPDLWLRADFEKEEDRCVRAMTGGRRHSRAVSNVGPPSCAAPLALLVRAGADVCQRLLPPTCPSGFRLEARVGEDRCAAGSAK